MSIISIVTSISLGAFHALEPGHGKTFLASYAISNDLDKKQTLKIITSMAISHSVLLLFLALIVPAIFPHLEESLHFYIQLIAALLVLFVGIKMLIKNKVHIHDVEKCSCGKDHSSISFAKPKISMNKDLKNKTFTFTNPNQVLEKPEPVRKNQHPFLVGFINGIMPCPSALAVVGMAFAYSSAWIISLTMLAYVAGFIMAMFLLLMIFVVLKSNYLKRDSKSKKFDLQITRISGVLIVLSSMYYLYLAFNHSH